MCIRLGPREGWEWGAVYMRVAVALPPKTECQGGLVHLSRFGLAPPESARPSLAGHRLLFLQASVFRRASAASRAGRPILITSQLRHCPKPFVASWRVFDIDFHPLLEERRAGCARKHAIRISSCLFGFICVAIHAGEVFPCVAPGFAAQPPLKAPCAGCLHLLPSRRLPFPCP